MRCSCFDVPFAVYSVNAFGVVSQGGKQKHSLSACLCPVTSAIFSHGKHFNRGSSACLKGGVCSVSCAQSWLLCRRLLRVRTGGGYRTRCIRLAMLRVSSRGLGRRNRLRTVVLRDLGGGRPCLRDLVLVPPDLWQDTVRDLQVPQGETERDLTPLEVGHVGMVRRIARPRLGLTAQDEVAAAAPTPRRRTRLWWSTARGREYWLRFPSERHGRATAQDLGSFGPSVGLRARALSAGKSTEKAYRLYQAARTRHLRGHWADLGASQCCPSGHYRRRGPLVADFSIVWTSW